MKRPALLTATLLVGLAVLLSVLGPTRIAATARLSSDTAPGAAIVRVSASASAEAGVASPRYLASDPARLNAVGARWSYDWSAQAPPRHPGLEWVPMIWGAGSVTSPVMAALRAEGRRGEVHDLLGFNEPDNPGQSNLSPARAAALWPALERTGLRLGSPAPGVPGDGWLARFMALAARRHLRVDFIALHDYPDFSNPSALGALRRQLLAIHRAYHRPIWITEIGSVDITGWGEPMAHPATEARAVYFLRGLVSMLHALPFVQRYAWFTDDCWNDRACHTSSLYDGTDRMTALGRAFAALNREPGGPTV